MEITPYFFKDDGAIPNNRLPLLVYSHALDLSGKDPAGNIERLFAGGMAGRDSGETVSTPFTITTVPRMKSWGVSVAEPRCCWEETGGNCSRLRRAMCY